MTTVLLLTSEVSIKLCELAGRCEGNNTGLKRFSYATTMRPSCRLESYSGQVDLCILVVTDSSIVEFALIVLIWQVRFCICVGKEVIVEAVNNT
jgi:hypothetical protein